MVKVRVTIIQREGAMSRPYSQEDRRGAPIVLYPSPSYAPLPPIEALNKWVAEKLGTASPEVRERVYKEVCAACEGVGRVLPEWGTQARVCFACKGKGVLKQSIPPR